MRKESRFKVSLIRQLKSVSAEEYARRIKQLPEEYHCQLASVVLFDITADAENPYKGDMSPIKDLAYGMPPRWSEEQCEAFYDMFIHIGYPKAEARKKVNKMLKLRKVGLERGTSRNCYRDRYLRQRRMA